MYNAVGSMLYSLLVVLLVTKDGVIYVFNVRKEHLFR
jgi:hypothetical protein